MDIVAQLSTWSAIVLGRYINVDWNPTNRGFGAQCWDLVTHWEQYNGWPVINTGGKGRYPGWAGNMVDAFPQTPEIAAAYELLPPSATVLAGDILVWDDSNPVWFPSTHTAVAVLDKGTMLVCYSQNSVPSQADNPYPGDSTGPVVLQHLPRKGLSGIIRHKDISITVQSSETNMEDADVKKIWGHQMKLDGEQLFTVEDVLRYANLNSAKASSEATNAKNFAKDALARATSAEKIAGDCLTFMKGFLDQQISTPDDEKKSFTLRDYIRYTWKFSMSAKDTIQAIKQKVAP